MLASIPFVFMGRYIGGGDIQWPSGVNIWDLSDAKVCKNSSAGITRNILQCIKCGTTKNFSIILNSLLFQNSFNFFFQTDYSDYRTWNFNTLIKTCIKIWYFETGTNAHLNFSNIQNSPDFSNNQGNCGNVFRNDSIA